MHRPLRRVRATLLAVLAFALVLAACGGDDGGTPKAQVKAPATTTAPPTTTTVPPTTTTTFPTTSRTSPP